MTRDLRTDFLIVDNARARWVRRSETADDDFVTVDELHADPLPPIHPQGVVFESGGGRFSVEQNRGAVQNRRYGFARKVAETINARVARGELERLSIVAPARTLQAIRRELTPQACAKLANVLAKDLTKTPDHDLKAWLNPLGFG
jgi:protein required for attachment to host cells